MVKFIRSGGLKHGTGREPLHRVLPKAAFSSRACGQPMSSESALDVANTMTDPSGIMSDHKKTVFMRKKYNPACVSNPVSNVFIKICNIEDVTKVFHKNIEWHKFFPPKSISLAFYF